MHLRRNVTLSIVLTLAAIASLPLATSPRPGLLRAGSAAANAGPTAPTRDDGGDGEHRSPLATTDADEPGTLLSYRFSAASAVDLGDQSVTTRLAGLMTLLVVDRRDDELLAELRFPDVRVSIDGGTDPATESFCRDIATAIAQPTALRVDSRGQTLGYRFATGMISDHRNWVRTLASAFRFVVDPAPAGTWTTTEGDGTGTAHVTYRRIDATADRFRVQRTRTRYAELPSAMPGGQAVACFEGPSIWPRSAEVDDRLTVELPEVAAQVRNTFGAHLELLRRVHAAELPAADWTSPWAEVSGADELSDLAASVARQNWQWRLDGVRVTDVLTRLSGILSTQPVSDDDLLEQLEVLAKLIELHPDALGELGPLVRDPASNANLVDLVLCAAARAGTAPAQALLLGCAEDGTLPAELRRNALESMFSLAAPSAATIAGVGAVLAGATAITPVESAAMLLLGACAKHDADAPALLLAAEQHCQSQGMTPVWLESLGNAGTADTFAAARRYCDAEDDTVRAAAMTALRKVDAADAVAILAQKVAGDSCAVVRQHAAQALAESPGPVTFALLAKVAAEDRDEHVRGAALLGLHRRLAGNSAVRDFLTRRAAEDPSDDLRRLATRLLSR